jgi:hypothetical protein
MPKRSQISCWCSRASLARKGSITSRTQRHPPPDPRFSAFKTENSNCFCARGAHRSRPIATCEGVRCGSWALPRSSRFTIQHGTARCTPSSAWPWWPRFSRANDELGGREVARSRCSRGGCAREAARGGSRARHSSWCAPAGVRWNPSGRRCAPRGQRCTPPGCSVSPRGLRRTPRGLPRFTSWSAPYTVWVAAFRLVVCAVHRLGCRVSPRGLR